MKKLILILVIVLSTGIAFAASPAVDSTVRAAIQKYKQGNYTGCMQDLSKHVEKKPTALGYYYLAMSYTQAGMQEHANLCYQHAIDLAGKENNQTLLNYAKLGKKKNSNPEAFESPETYDYIKLLLNTKNDIPEELKKDLQRKHLEYLRNEINAGKEPNF